MTLPEVKLQLRDFSELLLVVNLRSAEVAVAVTPDAHAIDSDSFTWAEWFKALQEEKERRDALGGS